MRKSVLLGIVLLCLVGITGNVWAESGLMAYYPFDGNAQDSSGNGYDGTVNGATYVSGISGLALEFDGSGDGVFTEKNIFSTADFSNGGTLMAWIKSESTTPEDQIITIEGGLWIGTNNGKFSNAIDGSHWTDSSTTVTDSTWHQLAMTFEKSGSDYSIKYYIDGARDSGQSDFTQSLRNLESLDRATSIGRHPTGEANHFTGLIDEVKIYNYALSASEIQANYDGIQANYDGIPSGGGGGGGGGTTTTTTTTTVPTTTTTVPPTTTPPPVQTKGSIIMTSVPTGSDILFDGAPIGQTPTTKSNLPVGIDHSIVVSKPGYYRQERIASATTDGTQVYVELNKIPEGRPVPHLTISQTATQTLFDVGEESLLQYGIFNDGDADAYDVKISMEVPSGVTASFVSGASKAGGLVTWTGDKIKSGATESATIRIKSEQVGKMFIPLRVSYKDDSGNKYIDDLSLSIETAPAPALTGEKDSDGDGWSDEQEARAGTDTNNRDTDGDGIWDPKDENPTDPNIPKKGICGPTALLGIALLPLGLWGLLKRRR